MPHLYSESKYDAFGCLKPPVLLWAAILYLSRAITLPIAMGIGHFSGVDPAAIRVFREIWNVEGLLGSAFAVVVFYALIRRTPGASTTVRWLWRRGRLLLMASAGINIAQALIAAFPQGVFTDRAFLSLLLSAGDAYFLLYLSAARRVRDTFAEFPSPAPATPGRA